MLSYLLLSVNGEVENQIREELSRFEFTVDSVNEGKGKYNIIARLVTNDQECLRNFISEQIDPLNGINEIKTIII